MLIYKPLNLSFANRLEAKRYFGHTEFNKLIKNSDNFKFINIYQTIQEAKESNIVTFPGIYFFKNKINNKYYIGQAVNIRKRFFSHILQIKKENNKYPIYRAVLKYGIENFEFGIIGVFKVTLEKNLLKIDCMMLWLWQVIDL